MRRNALVRSRRYCAGLGVFDVGCSMFDAKQGQSVAIGLAIWCKLFEDSVKGMSWPGSVARLSAFSSNVEHRTSNSSSWHGFHK